MGKVAIDQLVIGLGHFVGIKRSGKPSKDEVVPITPPGVRRSVNEGSGPCCASKELNGPGSVLLAPCEGGGGRAEPASDASGGTVLRETINGGF
jgi:hypothetical protein